MGRYIEWDDCVDRYPELSTLGGSDELTTAFIDYAEIWVDGLLAPKFTPPFSDNNMTVRDLSIDFTFARAGRFKLENAAAVFTDSMMMAKQLVKGSARMISTSGEVLGLEISGGVWSNTMSYHTAFGIYGAEEWHRDEDFIDAERDRG